MIQKLTMRITMMRKKIESVEIVTIMTRTATEKAI